MSNGRPAAGVKRSGPHPWAAAASIDNGATLLPGLDGVQVARFQTPPGEHIAELSMLNIGVHLGDPVTIVQERLGRSRRRQFVFGDVVIIPAETPNLCAHDEPTDDMYIRVDQRLLDEVAAEAGVDGGQVEITSNFGVQDPTIQHLVEALVRERVSPGLGGPLYTQALVNQLAIHLVRHHSGQAPPSPPDGPHAIGDQQLRAALEFIHDHLGSNLSLREVAGVAHLSPHHFSRSFKRATGMAPHQYVLRQRVELARRLLSRSRMSIAEVAAHAGFYDQSHLAAHFKRVFGVPPAALRNGRNIRPHQP
jgi:AraC family transcriptional regulator